MDLGPKGPNIYRLFNGKVEVYLNNGADIDIFLLLALRTVGYSCFGFTGVTKPVLLYECCEKGMEFVKWAWLKIVLRGGSPWFLVKGK